MKIVKKFKKFLRKHYAKLAAPQHFAQYLSQNTTRQLHLGCGLRVFKGWLNADLFSNPVHGVVYVNLLQGIPCPAQSFDYIYAEHVIEHFDHKHQIFIITECFRILKPGGVLRLAFPDIEFYAGLFLRRKNLNIDEMSFVDYFLTTFEDMKDFPKDSATILNGIFYAFGHRFIPSFESMENLLKQTGFCKVARSEAGCSEYLHLRNLETNTCNRQDSAGRDALRLHLMGNLSMEAVK